MASVRFNIVKQNYKKGLWTIETVKKAVKTGRITAEEFKEITGEDYTED